MFAAAIFSPAWESLSRVRVAIVHDWLYVLGGAERVLRSMLRCFPQADLFTLFDVLPPASRAWIGYDRATTSFMQRLPGIAKRHRSYLPLMPFAIEQFDVSGYDVVISSSYAVAKGVLTGPDQVHIAYVHSPMRYAWDLQHQYLREGNLSRGLKGAAARFFLHHMRTWDTRTSHGVSAYAVNSSFIARRVKKAYGREAEVIHPPVAVPETLTQRPRGTEFLAASRLVPYKNLRAVVEAFALLPHERLVVAGTGPEEARLRALAGPNVRFAGFVPDDELRRLMGTCRAFLFAAEEDFGIIPVEAMGEGAPVIALGRGGVRETIVTEGPGRTGVFFDEPSAASIAAAVRAFITSGELFHPGAAHSQALRFATPIFERDFKNFVEREMATLAATIDRARARALPDGMARLGLQTGGASMADPRTIQPSSRAHPLAGVL